MMSEQADQPDQPEEPVVPQADEPQTRGSSSSRIALFVILGIAVIVLIFDLYSRNQASAAYEKLRVFTGEYERSRETEAEKEKVRYGRNAITMAKVKEMVGKDPDKAADPTVPPIIEKFTFPGFMNHVITVIYSPAGSGESGDEKPQPYIVGAELDHLFFWQ